jgi:hypothetical protein
MSSTTLTPAQRSQRARIGALALHASGGTNTAAGTQAFLGRFEREVLEAAAARGEQLTPDENARRAKSARRAYFARLASSRARSKRAGPADNGPALEEAHRVPDGEHPSAEA